MLATLAKRYAPADPVSEPGAWCVRCGRPARYTVMATETLGLNYCSRHVGAGQAATLALRGAVRLLERRGVPVRQVVRERAEVALTRTNGLLDRVERLLLEGLG